MWEKRHRTKKQQQQQQRRPVVFSYGIINLWFTAFSFFFFFILLFVLELESNAFRYASYTNMNLYKVDCLLSVSRLNNFDKFEWKIFDCLHVLWWKKNDKTFYLWFKSVMRPQVYILHLWISVLQWHFLMQKCRLIFLF